MKHEDVHVEKESLLSEGTKMKKFVEFVSGPIGIGDDIKIKPNEVKVKGQTLYIFSPTDCIRDRLASYIHFKARECLDQAALVVKLFAQNLLHAVQDSDNPTSKIIGS